MINIVKHMVLLFCLYAGLVAASTDEWLRIAQPDQVLKNHLKSASIEYDQFIWVNKNDVGNANLSHSKSIDQYTAPFEMIVGNKQFDPLTSLPQNNSWFQDLSTDESAFYLLQFVGPIKSEWLQEIRELDIKLVKPMAPFSYIVWANKQSINQSKKLASVRWGGYFYSAFRVQTDNRNLDSQVVSTMALVYRENKTAVLSKLQSIGASNILVRDINEHFIALTFESAGNLYPQLSEFSGVLTVQKISQDAGSRGEMSQQSIVGNYDVSNVIFPGYSTWLNNSGLDGSGVVVGVVDGGVYENHPDLVGNILNCIGPGPSCQNDVDPHGTHVAGAIAGTGASGVTDGNGFLRGQGVAPAAKIIAQLYDPLIGGGPGGMIAGGMLSIYKDSAISGAMLTNNSWGPTGTPQGYDIPTMEIDIISRDADPDTQGHQPILAVWSIMNGGGDSNGACSPSSLGSPDEAKNLFAVGSTKLQTGSLSQVSDIFDISSNSAHGPACDGRIIPHIVAPGCNTDSPSGSSGYDTFCGTSMASPVVSGSVSLFWQKYKSTYAINPSPALVKATFTAAAQNLQGFQDADGVIMGQAPDRKQGWGRIDLDKVINPETNVWYFDQQTIMTQTGEMWTNKFYPDDPAMPVRLMLVWTDAPGAGLGGTTPAWVNDLDLTVNTELDLFKGNVFGNDGYSDTGGVADEKNNMEGIFLKADQHNGNSFDISVLAANLPGDALNPYNPTSPTQDFALVCYNCIDEIQFDTIFKSGFDVFIDLIFSNGFEQ